MARKRAKLYPYDLPLLTGTLLGRRVRFFADVKLADGSLLTAMCANTGSMKSCCEPGRPVLVSDSQNEKRKLRHTLELIDMGEGWVNVNTGLPNAAVERFVADGLIEAAKGFRHVLREQKYGKEGKSRIDLLLTHEQPAAPRAPGASRGAKAKAAGRTPAVHGLYIEVKNTSMRVGKHSVFPDSVTERGQKHLLELIDVVKQGSRAAMFFFCGREDTQAFRPADEIDKEYGKLLRKALKAGVEAWPYRVHFSPKGWKLGELLPLDFA